MTPLFPSSKSLNFDHVTIFSVSMVRKHVVLKIQSVFTVHLVKDFYCHNFNRLSMLNVEIVAKKYDVTNTSYLFGRNFDRLVLSCGIISKVDVSTSLTIRGIGKRRFPLS